MAKSGTTLKEGDKLPPRGKAVRTLILDAIRKNSLIGLPEGATRAEAEQAFFLHVAKSAFDQEDKDRNLCMNILATKGWANLKPSNETVKFNFDSSLKPHEQAAQVLQAVAEGILPPDIGNIFIQSIKSMIDIEEYTDLKSRIETLEKLLAGESE